MHERLWNYIPFGKNNGKIIWLTGLSGAGKTTLAELLKKKLIKKGEKVILLDGDVIREIFPSTGFKREDRLQHVERVGRAAILMASSGLTVICSLISPFEDDRNKIKNIAITNSIEFYLIFIKCSVNECIKRDVKGLYKKALNNEILDFTGISQPYEEPKEPNIIIDTEILDKKQSIKKLLKSIK